jgi:hypothetical protein
MNALKCYLGGCALGKADGIFTVASQQLQLPRCGAGTEYPVCVSADASTLAEFFSGALRQSPN